MPSKNNNKQKHPKPPPPKTKEATTTTTIKINSEDIKGSDDVGNFYSSLEQLATVQRNHRDEWYAANQEWWSAGGYGGLTDDEAMIGDAGGGEDGEEGLEFLDKLLQQQLSGSGRRAIDAGAGVGRVTKLVLLKRYDSVRLVEGNEHFSKRSRAYLGRKRAARCNFTCAKLEDLKDNVVVADWDGLVDLIWVQWTLQYLTDLDAENTLRTLAKGLVPTTGSLIVKENRPYGGARTDRFQMETPKCSGRYDIVRTDPQLRLIFHKAGLRVDMTEEGAETNTYAVRVV
jgi:protein N-terminal methyltransferase